MAGHDRRPGGAQPRHDRRLDRQQRPGRRLSGGGCRAERVGAHQQARDRRRRVLHRDVRDRAASRARSSPRCASRKWRRPNYQKFRNPASRYAIVGVFVAKTPAGVRVAVTGAGPLRVPRRRRWKRRSPAVSARTRSRTSQIPAGRAQLRHPRQRRIPRPSRQRDGPPGRRRLRLGRAGSSPDRSEARPRDRAAAISR